MEAADFSETSLIISQTIASPLLPDPTELKNKQTCTLDLYGQKLTIIKHSVRNAQ